MKTLLACAAILALGASLAEAEEYDVILHRQSKVGDHLDLHIIASKEDDQQWTVDKQPLVEGTRKISTKIDLEAFSKCKAVDKDGNPTEFTLTVLSCQFSLAGQPAHLFIGKDVIDITEHPRKVIVNGKPAEPRQAEMLADVFPPLSDDPQSDDKCFAPTHKVKVGDSWPVNAEAIAADMTKKGRPLSKDEVKGTMKLNSADAKEGIPCLQISGEMNVNSGSGALPGAPEGIECKKFSMQMKIAADLPVDTSRHRLTDSLEMRVETDGGGTMKGNGINKEVSFHMLTTVKRELTQKTVP